MFSSLRAFAMDLEESCRGRYPAEFYTLLAVRRHSYAHRVAKACSDQADSQAWASLLGHPGMKSTLAIVLLHGLEILLWASFYRTRCLPSWELAFYFSASGYSTVGYGDLILPSNWRSLGLWRQSQVC